MNLKFVKEDNEVKVYIVHNDKILDFDYIQMIKILYYERNIGETLYEGNFTKEEKESIERILKEIKNVINNTE